MNLNRIAILVSLSLLPVVGLAQEKVPTTTTAPAKSITWFFEKTYLHTDRNYYSTGEDLWFTAYLVNGKSASLTSTSNNLYVELISPASEIIDRKVIRMDQGLGKGDFKLKDSIPSGWYKLRAYTNWMRNFEDKFVFQKEIYLSNTLPLKGQNATAVKKQVAVNDVAGATLNESIQFFPEGGSLVNDLMSIVAFKAVDQYGNGSKISGKLVSETGETISSFESTDLGMGIFTVKPVAGVKYRVEALFANGKEVSSVLPDALAKGISMHVSTDSSQVKATISINEPMLGELQGKELSIDLRHGGNSFYAGNIKVDKSRILVSVPLKDLPQGVTAITLNDNQGRPHCERLIYVPGAVINLSVTSDKTSYKPKERVNLTVKASDQSGKPVQAYLSLAAVDAIVPANGSSITSYLLLESEIKGKIQDPDRYFDTKNAGRLKQLDLLLMTQGWRDYLWKRLAESKPLLSFMPEPGITLSGRVRQKVGSKPIPDMNITLMGNGLVGDKIYMTKSMADGRYFLDGLNWTGDQAIKLTSKDDKGKSGGWILLDSLFKNPMKIDLPVGPEQKSPDLAMFNTELARRMLLNRIAKINDTISLKEVVIDGKDKKTVRLWDETLTSFGYPDLEYVITPADYDYKGLEHFLLTKVPGAVSLSDTTDGIAFITRGKKAKPRFIVNRREDVFDRDDYYSLPMDQINKVVVRHMIRNGGEDAYLINLDLKETAFGGANLDVLTTTVPGYYKARVFYTPVYQDQTGAKKDLRTTIFWAPLLKTDAQGRATLSFLNAEPKSTISIRTEGITNNGVPIVATAKYQVQ